MDGDGRGHAGCGERPHDRGLGCANIDRVYLPSLEPVKGNRVGVGWLLGDWLGALRPDGDGLAAVADDRD